MGAGASLGPVSTGLAFPKGLARGALGAGGAAGLLSASALGPLSPASLAGGAVCWGAPPSCRDTVLRRVSTGLAEPKGLARGPEGAAGAADRLAEPGLVCSLAEEAGEEARLAGGRSGGGSVLGAKLSLHRGRCEPGAGWVDVRACQCVMHCQHAELTGLHTPTLPQQSSLDSCRVLAL